MTTELSKTLDPAAIESAAFDAWIQSGCFHADPAAAGEPYCIVIPPPNVTGALHLGHAINDTLQDILIRVHRMRGFNAVWIPGIDHAGIATQAMVEKQLKENENKTRHEVGREALVQRIWSWKEQFGSRILEQLKRLGCSCDWDRTRFTLDEQCAQAVRTTFFKLFKDGLIYRGKRLVNWDPFLQTSISDDEIYHETVKTSLWHIKYPIEGTDRHMVVATTRPETMLGDTAVAVHSGDARWNGDIGRQIRLPLANRLIPVIADDILVDPKFGSGVVKVTPAHDPNDYAVWQRHRSGPDQIDLVNILTPDGRMNEACGGYAGMKRDAARRKVVEDLEAAGLIEKIEPYETQVGHSDRSKTPVEPYLSDQWFVTMAPLAEPALEAVRSGRIQFHPERHAQQYLSWLGEKRDWPISRQLWWGHRIPIWSRACSTHAEATAMQARMMARLDATQAACSIQDDEERAILHICLTEAAESQAAFLEQNGFVQDPDVLDTWFSSALWPHSTLGWPEQTAELQKWYPTSVLVTGRDIITLWVARMVMMGLYNMKQIPFSTVAINPTILDGKGERMSKTKGNGVDPVEIINGYGADALRFTLTSMATETQDVRMPVKKNASGQNTSEKFDLGRNFANKLWNAARFALANLESIEIEPVDELKWSMADRWIVSRFNRAVQDANLALQTYRFDQLAKVCYDFFWRDLCDWYLEAIKPAMKDQRRGQTANVLASVLDGVLRLLHPIIPFVTEVIWWRLNEVRPHRGLPGRIECGESRLLARAPWPSTGSFAEAAEFIFPRLQDLISAIRNLRSEYKVDPRQSVEVSILAPGDSGRQIQANCQMIELLAGCHLKQISAELPAPSRAARATASGCEIFIEGLIDPAAERQRLDKEREKLSKQIEAMKSRLANEAYIAKAPAALVRQTQDQLREATEQLDKLTIQEAESEAL